MVVPSFSISQTYQIQPLMPRPQLALQTISSASTALFFFPRKLVLIRSSVFYSRISWNGDVDDLGLHYVPINPFPSKWVLRALIDFTLSNARRFYSSMGNLLDRKGLFMKSMSGPRASTILSHFTLKSHRTFKLSFSTTRSGVFVPSVRRYRSPCVPDCSQNSCDRTHYTAFRTFRT